MATTSPPKPWERAGGGSTSSAAAPSASTTSAGQSSTDASGAPAIPERPSSLSNVVNRTASNYSTNAAGVNSTFANRPYGSSPYGYGSTYNSFSSPYSRFGTGYGGYGGGIGGGMYGSSMYGGGMYGGGMYGGGMGGMYGGGMYGNGYGQPGDPNDPNNSLTNNFAQSTQATFQIIESIVGAFGGFAQMLESTYMATHSSFFAMVSVAEQFGNLRQTLGSILGIYAVLRWLRTLVAKLTGRPPPADATSLTPSNFFAFTGTAPPPGAVGPDGRPVSSPVPRPSKKPFIVFMLAVFGLPYLMGKLIRALAKSQEEMQQQQANAQNQQVMVIGPDGQPRPAGPATSSLDPSKLDFCRVLYDFPPAEALANGTFNSGLDLEVKKGDLVAVLDKSVPGPDGQPAPNTGEEAQWWRCRARDGRMGYLPAVYLETIQRRPGAARISDRPADSSSLPGSRSNTMPGSVTAAKAGFASPSASLPQSRAQTISSSTAAMIEDSAKLVGAKRAPELDLPVGKRLGNKSRDTANIENMQKAWIYDR